MLLEIRHVTQYQYAFPVRESVMEVWMQPQKGVRQRLGEKEEWLTRSIAQKLNDREKKVLGEAIEVLIKLIG